MFWMRTEPGRSHTLLMESVVDGNAMYRSGVCAVIIGATIKAEITDELSTCFPKRLTRRPDREPYVRVRAEAR